MTRRSHRLLPLLAAAAALLLAACAGQNASPTAPSTVAGASTSGVTILGQVASGSSTAVRAASTSSGLTVTVVGTNLSTPVQGNGQFTLENVPPGDVSLQFTGPGTSAMLTLGGLTAGQELHITVTVSGSQASMDSEDDQTTGSTARELEGLISSIDATGGQIVVNGTTVSVPATATIRHGSTSMTLAQLQVGQRVHVKGSMQGTVLVATEVMLQDEQTSPGNSGQSPSGDGTEVSGALAAAPTGTCPTVSFTVGTTAVSTTSTTTFEDGACTDLAAGTTVNVEGALSGTTLVATSVSFKASHGKG